MRAPADESADALKDERALVRGMIAGGERAFEQFCGDYVPALFRFAASRLGHDRELTREIVQATLVKSIAGLPSFRGDSSLMTWLCACCRTEIAAHFRRGARRASDVAWTDDDVEKRAPVNRLAPDGPEQALLRNEASARVHATLDRLPPHYARALEWKYVDGLPVKEIAGRLGVRAKAAESLLTRARGAFRTVYADPASEGNDETA